MVAWCCTRTETGSGREEGVGAGRGRKKVLQMFEAWKAWSCQLWCPGPGPAGGGLGGVMRPPPRIGCGRCVTAGRGLLPQSGRRRSLGLLESRDRGRESEAGSRDGAVSRVAGCAFRTQIYSSDAPPDPDPVLTNTPLSSTKLTACLSASSLAVSPTSSSTGMYALMTVSMYSSGTPSLSASLTP